MTTEVNVNVVFFFSILFRQTERQTDECILITPDFRESATDKSDKHHQFGQWYKYNSSHIFVSNLDIAA